eukprot:10416318-Alexandrium_andersonii.AAC.1
MSARASVRASGASVRRLVLPRASGGCSRTHTHMRKHAGEQKHEHAQAIAQTHTYEHTQKQ